MSKAEAGSLRKIALSTADTLQSYLNDTSDWKVSKKTKDILVEHKHSSVPGNEHGHLYRAHCELKCCKETVHKYMYPVGGPESELRKTWDRDISDIQLLARIDQDLSVNMIRTNSAAMGMIHPREYVDLMFEVRTDNYTSFNAVSIDYEDQPINPKFVRGWNHPSGFFCYDIPGQPGHTNFVLLVQTDIKGSLPRSLVDSAIPGAIAGLCTNLRNMLIKDGHLS
ncbi:star-related lipid transfer protein 5-like [Plakobranchus ocellatus]|uniref:Star-related lipid transfer protein 5-like n=1 Tax=Plakobranchus ocellatus TaxID=259542 RepID=A0AAV4DYI1_9GAST|nr:star-related lipid transfer protein 5-like [Plakobranchus ocellatus]